MFTQFKDEVQVHYPVSRYAMLRAWMLDQSPPLTMVALGRVLGMTSSSTGRALANDYIKTSDHAALVRYGIPVNLLPRPFDRRPGQPLRVPE